MALRLSFGENTPDKGENLMKTSLKILLLASVATAIAPIAAAQTFSLEARLQAMEAQISQLRAELAAEKAQTDNDLFC